MGTEKIELMCIGSWAAGWQSMYGGAVEAGSLFSYLQRMGMTIKA